eukprot:CAMPEP_0113451564 /NCGR_PEP_ID=MMETSP0014_2-20120614/6402_1 /TAXON_ID=2857 /ORGANISM="Nitzschia sp." /LENGTH=125 /DNA_ID=CAMNT_0000342921 /DNA_START=143 /DNA_END=520 /DNA_ORIENTATION=- /assembly_acc=CAM_ASM_000159
MAELMFGLNQTKKKKATEAKITETKKSLKDVNITDTVEKEVRKEQHERDQKWKKTGRDQIKSNTNFDMARSLFGGGGPPPAAADDSSSHDEQQEHSEGGGQDEAAEEHQEEADGEGGSYEEEDEE